jgi:hypothetical protein
MIKKNIGIIGFLIASIGIFIAARSKYLYNNELFPLFELSFLCWITASTIGSELNKPQPKNWYVYLVSIVSVIVFFVLLYLSSYC